MKDKEARQDIEFLRSEVKELKDRNWELKHKIWGIYEYFGIEELETPKKLSLVKKKT